MTPPVRDVSQLADADPLDPAEALVLATQTLGV
jgi:hypothetical protein